MKIKKHQANLVNPRNNDSLQSEIKANTDSVKNICHRERIH